MQNAFSPLLNFFYGGPATRRDPNLRRKIIMINVITLTAIVILIPMGAVAHWQGNAIRGFLDHGMAVTLSGLLIYLHWRHRYDPCVRFGIAAMGAFFTYLFITGGNDLSGHVWIFTFPLFASFLLGARIGLWYGGAVFAVLLAFLLGHPWLPDAYRIYPWSFTLRFIPAFMVVILHAFIFEYLRERTFGKLQRQSDALVRANQGLEAEVAERRRTARQLVAARKQAEAANQAKSEFLSNMSHELRTPLNHIIGFTELVVDGHAGDLAPQQADYLGDVLSSSRHLLALVNDVLDLSKVEAGHLELFIEPLDLEALITLSVTMIAEKATTHGIRIDLALESLPKDYPGDARKIRQVLYNLLSNAAKFTPDGGRISIEAGLRQGPSPEGSEVWIAVTDTGIGIAPDEMELIFRPFEQVDNGASRQFEGTGLGLSLSRQLMAAHGGWIRAESDGPGCGSRFSFGWPRRQLSSP
jgi:signal transduction histidine kinase